MDQDRHPSDEAVRARLRGLGAAATTLEAHPRETVEPRSEMAEHSGSRALERVATGGPLVGDRAGLRLERTLGEGGMGVVHLAEQVALGRKVAVKTLKRENAGDRRAKLRLLREAWVTGALEHPNVVPVHDAGLDEADLPVIVLKRIEGMEWGALMFDERAVQERFGASDLLQWNLEILMQVCNAMHFAHSRGIVHRDLKPENVMVGEFGEVYLLDWGIAVSTEDDGTGRFPLASRATEMAGTPCYMAPEMLGGSEPRLSARTDVYLLGATLFEILTGHPPHQGDTPMQLVRSVLASDPALPEDAPAELATICRRAMAPDPADRHASAEELRLAVQGFLRHRGSALLATEAWERLERLEREVKAGPDEQSDPEERTKWVYDVFGECRFGFRQAIRAWPENGAAQRGLGRALEVMVLHELSQGDPRAAERFLGEMDDPPPALAERVDRERAKDRERREQLEELAQAFDPHVGKRSRTFIAVLLGSLFTIIPAIGAILPEREVQLETFVATTAGFLTIALALGLWARESMGKTLINRRVFGTVVFVLATQLAFVAGAVPLGLDMQLLRTLAVFLWFVAAGMFAIYLDPRFFAVAAGYLAAFFASTRWPAQHYWIVAAANLNLTVFVVLLSRHLPRYAVPPDPFKQARERVDRIRTSRRPPSGTGG